MAGNTDYFPKQDAELRSWCENYRKTLPDFAAQLDLTPQEIADQQQWCDEIMQKITAVRAAKRQLKVLIESKDWLKKKNMDIIILNSLNEKGAGFEKDTNKITIFDSKGDTKIFDLKHKKSVAIDIFDYIIEYSK